MGASLPEKPLIYSYLKVISATRCPKRQSLYSDHFVRNDNSLLYYKGFILITFLRDAEEAGLVPNVVGAVGDVLVVNVQAVADFPVLADGI